MSAAADRPGPHPENQRKRQELRGARHALIGVLALVAVFAVAGVIASTTPPVVLVIAATQAVAAILVASHQLHARKVALAAALIMVAWGVAQILVWNVVTWFQLSLLAIGALEALLVAGAAPREPHEPRKRR